MRNVKCPMCERNTPKESNTCIYCGFDVKKYMERNPPRSIFSRLLTDKESYEREERYKCCKKKLTARLTSFIIASIALSFLFIKAEMEMWLSIATATLIGGIISLFVSFFCSCIVKRIKDASREFIGETLMDILGITLVSWKVGLIVFVIFISILLFVGGVLMTPITTLIGILIKLLAQFGDIGYAVIFFIPHVLFLVCTTLDIRYLIVHKK